ncbi:cytochrome c1 [Emcibacter nanhaiensis]|uniref:Cytochrome c1 n=1 Tax=Emcibacter nanhaiensis TaxID=1505037 RepID=A0A501PG33_9PROT|nr:cytochrome c1 [Emcibacter nanhaiensis]TPD59439.1 cytochrome c1 [Emcibacter nanhaiensis]
MLKSLKNISLAVVAVSVVTLGAGMAHASGGGEEVHIEKHEWPHAGPFGTYDKAALQRGFQVYKEVCSACHSLKMVAFRELEAFGYNEDELKAIAKDYEVVDGPNDDGEMFTRPGRPSDYFPSPFANEQEARAANGGAYPPDFSVLAKSREHLSLFTPWNSIYGEDYIMGILTGYEEAPEGFHVMDGLHYNRVFAGHQIAMAAPLGDDQVEYADGTPATVEQMAHDVATFMYWASEPKLEARKSLGLRVMGFMIVLTILLYFANKSVWAKLDEEDDQK